MEPMRYTLTGENFGAEERLAFMEVLDSGRFTMSERVRAFEEAFARRLGVRHALMVNSGSSANLVAVAALFFRRENPLRPGDEVVVPCISWATTYYPLQQYGLRLRFVDVDPRTLNCDPDLLEAAITPATRMVVAVSILGNPCRFDRIVEICRRRGLILFEDNCESLGARFGGRPTGTFGLINTFSTFFSHQLSTIEGGVVVTDDFELACLARSLRNHGWTRDQDADSPLFERRGDDFFEAYRFILPGYNLRATEFQGALGLVQLAKLDGMLAQRRRNAELFCSLFANDPRFLIQQETGESSWFCFTMIVRPETGIPRERVLAALRAAGIEHRIITGGNFLRHDVIRYFDHVAPPAPNADLAHDNGFFVGNWHADLRPQIEHLHRTLGRL